MLWNGSYGKAPRWTLLARGSFSLCETNTVVDAEIEAAMELVRALLLIIQGYTVCFNKTNGRVLRPNDA